MPGYVENYVPTSRRRRHSQVSFGAGVLSQEASARADMEMHASGMSLAKNWIVTKTGSLTKRPGLEWLGHQKYSKSTVSETNARLVEFDWGDSDDNAQTYVLEFGDLYMRVWKDGGQVLYPAGSAFDIVVAATYRWQQANGAPDVYYLDLLVGGDPGIDEPMAVYEDADGTPVTMPRFWSGVDLPSHGMWWWGDHADDSLGYDTVYVHLSDDADPDSKADGYLEAGYPVEIALPYDSDEVPVIDHVQSADVVTVTHETHPVKDIARTDHHLWTCTSKVFGSRDLDPIELDVRLTTGAPSASDAYYQYAISAEDYQGVESRAVILDEYWVDFTEMITTDPNSLRLTIEGEDWEHTALADNDNWPRAEVKFYHIYRRSGGDEDTWSKDQWGWLARFDPRPMHWDNQLGERAVSSVVTQNPLRFNMVAATWDWDDDELVVLSDFSGWTVTGTSAEGHTWAQIESGEVQLEAYGVILSTDIKIREKGVVGDYDGSGWTFSVVGSFRVNSKAHFIDDGGVDPDFSSVPIIESGLFEGAGDYPSCVSYYADRLILAATLNAPQGLWMSQPGRYAAFNSHATMVDSDAITRSLPARQSNRIRSLTPADSLMAATSGGMTRIWAPDGIVSPYSLQARPQSERGVAKLKPLIAGKTVLYVSDTQRTVLATRYSLADDGYVEDDISIRAAHYFRGRTIIDWTYSHDPHNIAVLAMSDGNLLTLTWVPEQKIWAWAEHPIDGWVTSLACVREGTVDAVYAAAMYTKYGRDPIAGEGEYVVRGIARLALEDPANICESNHLDFSMQWEADTVTGATPAPWDPCTMQKTGHGLSNGDIVMLCDWASSPQAVTPPTNSRGETMEDVNGRMYEVYGVNGAAFYLENIETGEYLSGDGWLFDANGTYNYKVAATRIQGMEHIAERNLATNDNVKLVSNGLAPADSDEPYKMAVIDDVDLYPWLGYYDLTYPATYVTIGLGYKSSMRTLDMRGGPGGYATDSIPKYTGKVAVRVKDSVGVEVGNDEDSLQPLSQLEGGESSYDIEVPGGFDGYPTMVNGLGEAEPTGGWLSHGRIMVEHDLPVPATIIAIIPEVAHGG